MTAPTPAEQLWYVAEALQQHIAAQAAEIERLKDKLFVYKAQRGYAICQRAQPKQGEG